MRAGHFKKNMFGKYNLICFFFGHNLVLFSSGKAARCARCELPKLDVNVGEGVA